MFSGEGRHGPYPPENLPPCEVIDNKPFEDYPGQEHTSASNPTLKRNPHPLSDFSHVDPQETPESPPNANRPDFEALRNKFNLGISRDNQRIAELDYLQRLSLAVGPDSESFQRLRRCFDLVVCRAHKLLMDINLAAKADNAVDYAAARNAYREFVANLDDREAQFKRGGLDVSKRFGYGKNFQWALIDPVVEQPEGENCVLITNARIIIKWNPHSSSSGVPILH